MYRKSTQTAFAAMALLAETYDGGTTKISASDIAERRGLALPYLSKVLTELVQAGLVHATRGPGGGFALSRDPSSILLSDISGLFERGQQPAACPFGAGTCGVGQDCPLHDRLASVRETIARIVCTTTLAEFRRPAPPRPQ